MCVGGIYEDTDGRAGCASGADDGRGGLVAKVADFGLHAIVQATDADNTVKKLCAA